MLASRWYSNEQMHGSGGLPHVDPHLRCVAVGLARRFDANDVDAWIEPFEAEHAMAVRDACGEQFASRAVDVHFDARPDRRMARRHEQDLTRHDRERRTSWVASLRRRRE